MDVSMSFSQLPWNQTLTIIPPPPSFNPLSVLLSLIFFPFLHFLITKTYTKTHFNLPPSPPKFPLIGNLYLLSKRPYRSMVALSKKYGPVMLIHIGRVPNLIISSPEMVKEMVKSQDVVFSDRSRSTAVDIYRDQAMDVAYSPYGEYWRKTRKVCVVELLCHARVQSLDYIRQQEVESFVNELTSISQRGRIAINLSDMVLRVTNNIVTRCVIGCKCEGGNGKLGFGELSRRVGMEFGYFSFRDWFPYLGWVDSVSGLISGLKETHQSMEDYVDEVIEERLQIMKNDDDCKYNDGENKKEDFVDALLRIQKDGSLDFDLTLGDIKAVMLDMIVGGTDTTATTMEWVMAELMKNPTVLKRVQEEARSVVGKKQHIENNDINQMSYFKCAIKETLRLHGPAFLIPRETSSNAKLGGYDIPAKTRVLINTWAIQRDPRLWENPEEFKPERFIDNPIEFRSQDFRLLPFGGGRRGCPGMSFGIATVEYVIANLLWLFDWELPDGVTTEDLDMEEAFALTVPKQVPLMVVPSMHHH